MSKGFALKVLRIVNSRLSLSLRSCISFLDHNDNLVSNVCTNRYLLVLLLKHFLHSLDKLNL